jgi:hypothetical protein
MALPVYRVAKTISGNGPEVRQFTCATHADSTFVRGQLVSMNTGNTVQIARVTDADVLGIALDDWVAGAKVLVAIANDDTVFSGGSTATSGTYDDELDFCDVTTLTTALDVTAASTVIWQIQGLDDTESASRFLVKINPAIAQGMGIVPTIAVYS